MKYILTLSIALLMFSGCASKIKPITHGEIKDSGIVITAEDNSFKLQGKFKAPFHSDISYNSVNVSGNKMIKGYFRALQYDAKHVRVKVPYKETELYGVLVLDNAQKLAVGPGSQSYKIIIPKPYVDAATGGKISVVYEYYHIEDDSMFDLDEIKKYSWILWLSDEDVFK